MSAEVDALVLINKAYDISLGASNADVRDISQSLYHVRSGDNWGTGSPVSPEGAINVWSAEVFANLGGLVANRFLGNDMTSGISNDNPALQGAIDRVGAFSPFAEGESLQDYLRVYAPNRLDRAYQSLASLVFRPMLSPELTDEFEEKWAKAESIDHTPRTNGGILRNGVLLLDAALDDLSLTHAVIL